MAKMRYVSDSFWTDSYVEDLKSEEKLLFLYLLTNPLCNIAGIYEITERRISYETGIEKKALIGYIEKFINDKKLLKVNDWIILRNFAKSQSLNPKVKQGMQRIIDDLPVEVLKIKGFDSLSHFTLLNLTLPNLTLPNGNSQNSDEDFDEGKKQFGEFVRLSMPEETTLRTKCKNEDDFNEIIEDLNIAIGKASDRIIEEKYSNHYYAFLAFLKQRTRNKSPAKSLAVRKPKTYLKP